MKILSALLPHIALILVTLILVWVNGFPPTLYSIQLLYYILATSTLLLGLGWITSSTSLFIKDVPNIVNVLVQFGFWLTPLFWSVSLVPDGYQWMIKMNPVYYLVEGYRDSLVSGTAFWEKPGETLYFWVITIVLLVVGTKTFRKLRPEFAEIV